MKTEASHAEPRTIAAGEFKAKCLNLMDEAVATQQSFVITKRGKPVGRFVPEPAAEKPFRSIFGRSPGIRVPTASEWRKLKEESTEMWDESTERLARQLQGDFRETKKKR